MLTALSRFLETDEASDLRETLSPNALQRVFHAGSIQGFFAASNLKEADKADADPLYAIVAKICAFSGVPKSEKVFEVVDRVRTCAHVTKRAQIAFLMVPFSDPDITQAKLDIIDAVHAQEMACDRLDNEGRQAWTKLAAVENLPEIPPIPLSGDLKDIYENLTDVQRKFVRGKRALQEALEAETAAEAMKAKAVEHRIACDQAYNAAVYGTKWDDREVLHGLSETDFTALARVVQGHHDYQERIRIEGPGFPLDEVAEPAGETPDLRTSGAEQVPLAAETELEPALHYFGAVIAALQKGRSIRRAGWSAGVAMHTYVPEYSAFLGFAKGSRESGYTEHTLDADAVLAKDWVLLDESHDAPSEYFTVPHAGICARIPYVKSAFEEPEAPLRDFGWALGVARTGGRVRRPGWPECNYLRVKEDEMGKPCLWIGYGTDGCTRDWYYDSDDILAEDWVLLDETKTS